MAHAPRLQIWVARDITTLREDQPLNSNEHVLSVKSCDIVSITEALKNRIKNNALTINGGQFILLSDVSSELNTFKQAVLEQHSLFVEEIKESFLETLATLEHEQWAHWTKYMLNNLTPENIQRWKKQIETPYEELSEKEKESDRKWAMIVVDAFLEVTK